MNTSITILESNSKRHKSLIMGEDCLLYTYNPDDDGFLLKDLPSDVYRELNHKAKALQSK